MNDASGFTPVPPQADISIPIVTPADIAADTALPLGSGVPGADGSSSSGSGNSAGSFVTGLLSRGTLQTMLGTLSPSVNERMQAFRQTQQKAMQPWREFFGTHDPRAAFGVGHPQYVVPRLRSNLARYRWNYVALCGATVALLALFSFTFFVLALAVLALWAYVFFWRAEPFVVAGVTLTRTQVTVALALLTALVSYVALGNRLFVIAAVDAVFCLLHALFRVSQEETIDFSRPA